MPRSIDPTERAHLRDSAGYAPPIYRYQPDPGLTDLVRRYWIPVWALPDAETSIQRVLQYPVCLLVVSSSYAVLVGVTTGLSVQELRGSGWAVGVMLQPAAGALLLGESVAGITDRRIDLVDVPGIDGEGLVAAVHAAMSAEPSSPDAHRSALSAVQDAIRALGPADDEGLLINRIVESVENRPEVRRVGQICDEFHLTERSLQRLTTRRLGLTPKWLIQRRRLHDAAERLRAGGDVDLGTVAAELGYADQAHFTRDFRTATGVTPGAFQSERPASAGAPTTGRRDDRPDGMAGRAR